MRSVNGGANTSSSTRYSFPPHRGPCRAPSQAPRRRCNLGSLIGSTGGREMSLWKRLAGVASGLAADAHLNRDGSIGNLLRAVSQRYVSGPHHNGRMSEYQVAFTVAVIALGAKMAKADGIVTRDEVLAFKQVFKVPDGEIENVSRIFNLAKQNTLGYESFASQLASLLKRNHRLLEDVLEGLFHIAMADGVFHPNEERFLAKVARRFGFTDVEFSYIKARHAG